MNRFPLTSARRYVFVAAGIGITPILPMVKAVDRRRVPAKLIYLGRSRESMAFVDDLSSRPNTIVHTSASTGRFDVGSLYPDALDAAVYVCGPARLIDAVAAAHVAAGACRTDLHTEYFHTFTPSPTEPVTPTDEAFEVQLGTHGPVVHVGPSQTILDALLESGFPVPYSCQEGECGTCQTTVLAGEADHRDDTLSAEEYEDGEMLICVSRSRSPRLVLDLDAERPAPLLRS